MIVCSCRLHPTDPDWQDSYCPLERGACACTGGCSGGGLVVSRPDYMHEMLTECPHRPYCHDSWDPCLLALQHPHALGATGKFAGPFDACPRCQEVAA